MVRARLLTFQLGDYSGHFTGDFQWKDRRIKGSVYNGESIRRAFFEELKFNGNGSIYHPNLFNYFIDMGLGFNQSQITWSGEKNPYSKDKGFFRDMMFRGVFLQKKPYNIIMSYRKNFRQLNNNFFEDSYNYTHNWQVQTRWQNPYFPVNFGYSSDTRDEYYGPRYIYIAEKRFDYTGGWGKRDQTFGDLRLSHLNLQRTEKGLYDIRQKNTTLQTSLTVPSESDKIKGVRSSVFANYITGSDSITTVNWTTTTGFNPRKNLWSKFNYSYRYYDTNGRGVNSHQVAAELGHQLYLSLESTLNIQYNRYLEKGFDKIEWRPNLGWKYTKRLPKGQLDANYKIQPRRENIYSEQGFQQRGEWVVMFDQLLPVLIPQNDVILSSIEVISLDRTITYVPNLDYQVLPYGTSAEIQRLPGSAIPDSVDVIVLYLFQGSPSQEIRYTFRTYGLSYKVLDFWGMVIGFKGFTAYYPEMIQTTWSRQDPRKVSKWYLKAEYSPLKFEFNHETSTSKITPYTKTSFSVNGIIGSYVNQYLLMRTQIGQQILPLRNDNQKYNNFNVEYFRRLARSLRLSVSFGQRRIKGLLNDLDERKFQVALKYSTRSVVVDINYQFATNTFFTEKETNKKCNIGIIVNP